MSYAIPRIRIPSLATSLLLCQLLWCLADLSAVAVTARQESEPPPEQQLAWEYRPYKVLVWLTHADSWRLQGLEQELISQIEQQARLADPSGWRLTVKRAPNPWNWRLLSESFDRDLYAGDLQTDVLNAVDTRDADKLLVVKIQEELGQFVTQVQEFDLRTRVWGAQVIRGADTADLDSVIFESIRTAFMPITRIENVLDDDVRVRVRAIGICNIAERDETGQWRMVENTGSPAWINDDEILLPVILRSDRRGNLESIKTVDWTFLSIADRSGPNLNCKTHSMRRAPLGQRTGGRTERLGLCVRAPDRATTLTLISNDKEQIPLPDLEIYSRPPELPKEVESEFLGKTDWRGQILIPPNEDPIRILYVKSGRRPLARVPLVPGLYQDQSTSMPNDEKRLYAEGIVRGLENELLDNVARRQLIAERVRIALERSDLDAASEFLRELRDIPDAQKFNIRLNFEKQRLLLGDDRQQDFIKGYFLQLENASSQFLNTVQEGPLNKMLQDAKNR